MRTITRAFAALGTAGALALATPAAGQAAPRHCVKRFTLAQFERAASVTYIGTGLPQRGAYSHLWAYLRCQRTPGHRTVALAYWKARHDAWAARRHPPMNGPVTASWFDDTGATACGIHATYGFATLNGTPCGGVVTMRGPSGVLVRAVREDSGPYVGGRMFDLNYNLKQALGCSDLCSVWYR